MSQVVMLRTSFAAVSSLNDCLAKVARVRPRQAQALAKLDLKEVVNECVGKAIAAMLANHKDITRCDGPADYYNKEQTAVDGLNVIAAFKSTAFTRGIGVMMDNDGTIRYSGDVYGGQNQAARNLINIFEEYLKIEIAQAAAKILDYKAIASQTQILPDGDPVFTVEMIKVKE